MYDDCNLKCWSPWFIQTYFSVVRVKMSYYDVDNVIIPHGGLSVCMIFMGRHVTWSV